MHRVHFGLSRLAMAIGASMIGMGSKIHDVFSRKESVFRREASNTSRRRGGSRSYQNAHGGLEKARRRIQIMSNQLTTANGLDPSVGLLVSKGWRHERDGTRNWAAKPKLWRMNKR